jgi:hypothetical protein
LPPISRRRAERSRAAPAWPTPPPWTPWTASPPAGWWGHVADWDPPPATVALRLPCPARRDAQRRELIDLLVVAGDGQAGVRSWRQAAGGLAEQMWRWSGNRVYLHVHTPAQLADAGDGELHAAAWTLVAGARVASLPFAGAGAPRSA